MDTGDVNLYDSFLKHGGFFRPQDQIWEAKGPKADAFLHGQLTNHIKGLKTGEANYNLLLTQKGKIVSDLRVAKGPGGFFLFIPASHAGKVIGHLKTLAPLSRVTLEERKDLVLFHLISEGNPTGERFPSNRIGYPGWDILTPADSLPSFQNDPVPEALQDILRVEQGIPKLDVDFNETNLPQEARLERALHFDKGCYLGQEIVARLQYRGHVNKVLAGLEIRGEASIGSSMEQNGKKSGPLTSVILSPKRGTTLALGYIPYDLNHLGTSFTGQDFTATIIPLP